MSKEQITPIVAIVGRPNTGKSSLFNRLTRTRQALVDNWPGVTRDRLYGQAVHGNHCFTFIDTGGFDPPADQNFSAQIHAQIELAIAEADAIIFLTDGRQGLNPLDEEISRRLRRYGKPLLLAVNKTDNPGQEDAAFYQLSCQQTHFISAAHGYGIGALLDALAAHLPSSCRGEKENCRDGEEETPVAETQLRVSFLGRPNVGKSSLLNALTGSQRAVVSDIPGTTRDALDTPFTMGGQEYLLIDTAGIRRTKDPIESIGVEKSRAAADSADLILRVLDAAPKNAPAPADNEIIVINKCDSGKSGASDGVVCVSAKNGFGIDVLLRTMEERINDATTWAENDFVANERARAHLERAVAELDKAGAASADLQAEHITAAADEIGLVLGFIGSDEIYDSVFGQLCLGK
jgi:ribosome-associated GTPase EngA